MSADDPAASALPRELEELCTSPAFRCAIIGMAALAPDFRILRVNEALASSLGYRPEQMECLPPERFTHPDDVVEFAQHLASGAASGAGPAPFRKRCLIQRGGHLWCDLSFTAIHGEAGLAGWLCQVQDVTELQRAQERLERERRLFVSGPVVVFRWANAPGWPVEYVSPNVREAFGWEASELATGTIPYAELVHPDDRQRVAEEILAHAAQGRNSYEQVYRLKHRDGGWRWIRDFTVIHDALDLVRKYAAGNLLGAGVRLSRRCVKSGRHVGGGRARRKWPAV